MTTLGFKGHIYVRVSVGIGASCQFWEGGQEHLLSVQGIWVAGEVDMYHCSACSKWYHKRCTTPVDS